MKTIPIAKARATSHPCHWVYRFAEDAPYTSRLGGEAKEIRPGTECRNTGCCDANGTPIYEHDYVESWHSRERHDMLRDIAEMMYVGGVLMKHIDGFADVPVAYQYRHDIYNPLRLDCTKVLGNAMGSGHIETERITTFEYDKRIRQKLRNETKVYKRGIEEP